jgi:hypothetical protein
MAEKEYDKFRVIQDQNFVSDFDKEIKKINTTPQKNKNARDDDGQ